MQLKCKYFLLFDTMHLHVNAGVRIEYDKLGEGDKIFKSKVVVRKSIALKLNSLCSELCAMLFLMQIQVH